MTDAVTVPVMIEVATRKNVLPVGTDYLYIDVSGNQRLQAGGAP
jgi:hypothetical protein